MTVINEKCNCSFCGKSNEEVEAVIKGHNAYICEDCLELCCQLMELQIPGWFPEPYSFVEHYVEATRAA